MKKFDPSQCLGCGRCYSEAVPTNRSFSMTVLQTLEALRRADPTSYYLNPVRS